MSTHAELARIFTQIADILDITGANAFRVNAHRKAMERLLVLAHREGYTPGGQLALERVFHESTLQS